MSQFKVDIVKIGYCYVGGLGCQLTRHCVVITNKNKVIDISALLNNNKHNLKEIIDEDSIKYYIFAELDCSEYSRLLEEETYNPELKKGLVIYEKIMIQYLYENNLEVNDYDFNKYLLPLTK
ncbi:hypothetical protein [Clostridium tagluense]|uniref:Uncharacterized protein n=1 Tax=Clostridium tagluense TaxID=360422 RepID=A0A401USR0_9CLOT|nr:hypothetical protein [Clostridium tagluense]GCD12583.1 hypothetical protein Ctaglu_42060 [Clostridium tagluense]